MTEPLELFPWSSNFETGISEIDEQHQVLVKLINELAQQLASESEVITLTVAFNRLAEYAVYHFKSEEIIWQRYFSDQPDLVEHAKTHQKFIASINNLQSNNSESSHTQNIAKIMAFLIHWLIDHILNSDMRMAKIVLNLQASYTFQDAEKKANYEMTNVLRNMLETTKMMYNHLTSTTLELIREKNTRKAFEKKLQLAANVFENTLEAICITDASYQIIDANPAFYQSTGYTESDATGQALEHFKSGLKDPKLHHEIQESLQQTDHWSGEITNRNKDGGLKAEWLSISAVKNQENELEHYVEIFSNITSLINNKYELEHLAHHDALTGLPNRLLLTDRFESSIANAQRHSKHFACCYLDLDGFKPVNDQYSHAAGDIVLCTIAKRIKHLLRSNDTIARIGGDEFILLLNDLVTADDCKQTLERLLKAIAEPIDIGDKQLVSVGVSTGVALYPEHGNTHENLLSKADSAMYIAKERGKSQYAFAN